MNILRKLSQKREKLLFISILLIGTVLRFYRLPETMQFLGDQGRDALIARAILIEHDPAFIGPVTSVGNMYLGPFYYYFMVLPLMLTYPNPVGPAIAVALVGISTLALIYILGKDMFGKQAALFAMGLYAISPVVIANVRFSWNPNIVPFFSIILVWSVWKTLQRKYDYWVLAGICVAALFQLHYIALILIGCVGLVWLYELLGQIQHRTIDKTYLKSTALAILIFIISLTPILLFDLKHNWLNVKAFLQFFHPSVASERHFRPLTDLTGIGNAILSMLARVVVEFFGITAQNIGQKILVSIAFVYVLIRTALHKERSQPKKIALFMIIVFFGISVFILSLYSSSVFDHYLGFILPVAFLLFGVVISSLYRSMLLRPLVIGLCGLFIWTSMLHYPGFVQMSGTIYELDASASVMLSHIPDGTYNILAYSPSKDLQGMNYRYFLTAKGKKPVDADDWLSSQYLVIIDEEHRAEPFDESQYVIKIWPNRTIIDEVHVPNGPDVYVLKR